MNNVFWIGVYPGLTPEMLDYAAETIQLFTKNSLSASPLVIL